MRRKLLSAFLHAIHRVRRRVSLWFRQVGNQDGYSLNWDGARDLRPAAPARAMQVAPNAPSALAPKRFLVVEDEPLVALDLSAGLQDSGAEVVATTGSVQEALDIIESKSLDAALLDGNLHGRPVDEVAAALTRRNVPFLFVTGYGSESLPQAFRHAAILTKPFSHEQLIEAAARLIERRDDVARLRDV